MTDSLRDVIPAVPVAVTSEDRRWLSKESLRTSCQLPTSIVNGEAGKKSQVLGSLQAGWWVAK